MKILLTGGSSGLGESILKKIIENHEVHFTYNKSIEKSNDLVKKYKNAIAYKCDLTNKDDLQKFITKIKDIKFDVLINNYYSGNFLNKHFTDTPASEITIEIENNIVPVVQISQIILKNFKLLKRGLIISISSEVVNNPPIGSTLYVITKSIIEELSKIWNVEFKKFGIHSTIISPSFMRTNLTSNIDERMIELFFENENNINEKEKTADAIANILEEYLNNKVETKN